MMESKLSKVNSRAFFIYQITNRQKKKVLSKEPFLVTNYEFLGYETQKRKILPYKCMMWSVL